MLLNKYHAHERDCNLAVTLFCELQYPHKASATHVRVMGFLCLPGGSMTT